MIEVIVELMDHFCIVLHRFTSYWNCSLALVNFLFQYLVLG